jgi:hypothetical protein
MLYIKVNNNEIVKYPYSIRELKMDNPNVSFPVTISTELLNSFGVYIVTEVTSPTYEYTKVISEINPTLIDGVWTQTWLVEDATTEEIEERTSEKWDEIRSTRNTLLSESDWTQVSDSPLNSSQEWKDYRQSLRDITNQSNPFEITWPTKP